MTRHAVGVVAAGAVWGGQDICVLLLTRDPQLQFLVLTVQAGWIAGASVRLAISPAVVLGQLLVSLAPTVVCLAFVPVGLITVCLPAGVLHILAMLRITQGLGLLLARNIESEQRAEAINAELSEANAKLLRLSLSDGLTGIANRRALDAALEDGWSRPAAAGGAVALLMVDVDFFKLYNDRYGHQAGDACLRRVAVHAAACRSRAEDMVARYGGEEFAILLFGTDQSAARLVAERLRTAIAESGIAHEAAPLGRLTVSVGVAQLDPAFAPDPQTLVSLADAALYEAKRAGRNRVHVAGAEMIEGPRPERAKMRL